MKINLLILLLLGLQSFTTFAQKEATNWLFGDRSGLTFKSGTGVTSSGGVMFSQEGCASVSDPKTGALLFYTNGISVWNSNNQVLKNGSGLKGGSSSTQNVLIVPNPTNKLQYYIFTVPDLTNVNGVTTTSLFYSIVNMGTSGGEILSKNTFLIDGISEKLTGTLDCNGTGFWVVIHNRNSSIFYSYHVTSSGVSNQPVISTYGGRITDFTAGYIKISPDRTKLALASNIKEGYVALFDFNAKTGEIKNYAFLGGQQAFYNCYGVAFSADNTKLYATAATNQTATAYSVFQYDISLSDIVSIRNSLYQLGVVSIFLGALQLAEDGKIYVAQDGTNFVGLIDKPNLRGPQSNFKTNIVPLSGTCRWGLPNFMDYIFNNPGANSGPLADCLPPNAITKPDTGCINTILIFNDVSTNKPTRREWKFDNGIPATSTDSSVSVSFTQSGTHKVRLIVINDNGRDTTYTEAVVLPIPKADAGADKTVCLGETAKLGIAPDPNNKYNWQPIIALDNPTKSNPIVTPTATTRYILSVTNTSGCIAYDTVLVTVGNIVAKVSADTAICSGSSVQLLASGGSEYEWSPSVGLDDAKIPNPIATPSQTTTYNVIVSSGKCRDSAFVTVTVNPKPTANAGEDKTICTGASIEIGEKATAGNTYSWQPSNGLNDRSLSNPIASPSTTTEYILTVTGIGGCVNFDTVLVTVGNISVKVSGDTAICEGSSVQLMASGGSEYLWSPSVGLSNPNITNPIANPTKTTTYKVVVSSGLCIDSAFVTVSIVPLPIANAGQDTIICVGESVQIGVSPTVGNSYSWKPSIGLNNPSISNPIASPNSTTEYILTATNSSGCVNYDTVKITVNPSNERTFTLTPSLITILPGQQFQTALNVPNGVNSWNIRLGYDSLVVRFASILQTTNSITVIPTEQNGQLTLQGKGENGNVLLQFNTFLPYNSDTTFPIKLTINSAELQPCETVTSLGNMLQLGEYCGKRIRMVSSTGKNYFLTTKENGVNFGVGLSGNVRIELYDNIGSLKEVLVSGSLEAGEYGLDFDVPTGVYFCRMSAGMFERVGMVVVVR
ncbi:MAG: hypothetical protein JST20_12640 [Bacteroidetes bacterium]|nr:hypothetical protein [Bacteroidota bacterium]